MINDGLLLNTLLSWNIAVNSKDFVKTENYDLGEITIYTLNNRLMNYSLRWDRLNLFINSYFDAAGFL